MSPAVPPTSYSSPYPVHTYHMIPNHMSAEFGPHMRYAAAPGHMEHIPLPQMVFPYAMAPGQGPVFTPMPHPGMADGLVPRSHYPNFIPMPLPGGPMPRGMMSPDGYMETFDHLNPMAKEFIPPLGQSEYCSAKNGGKKGQKEESSPTHSPNGSKLRTRKRRSRRGKDKQNALQDNIKRTIYISDIDQQVTEEALASVFTGCGTVVDCRVCGDPNSAMRFAFIEFLTEECAQKALKKNGSELGTSRLRVLPSKTAIVPVNKDLMPKNKGEMEQCSRTIYATNIDKKVDREDVKRFFEALCGPVTRLRLLGDHAHSTRIAFVEFTCAEAALAALSCSGALLGTMPIRVSPSKTPVRFSAADEN